MFSLIFILLCLCKDERKHPITPFFNLGRFMWDFGSCFLRGAQLSPLKWVFKCSLCMCLWNGSVCSCEKCCSERQQSGAAETDCRVEWACSVLLTVVQTDRHTDRYLLCPPHSSPWSSYGRLQPGRWADPADTQPGPPSPTEPPGETPCSDLGEGEREIEKGGGRKIEKGRQIQLVERRALKWSSPWLPPPSSSPPLWLPITIPITITIISPSYVP